MGPINTAEVILEARRMRALDLRRGEPVVVPRMRVYVGELSASLGAAAALLGEVIGFFFSWNPQARKPRLS